MNSVMNNLLNMNKVLEVFLSLSYFCFVICVVGQSIVEQNAVHHREGNSAVQQLASER